MKFTLPIFEHVHERDLQTTVEMDEESMWTAFTMEPDTSPVVSISFDYDVFDGEPITVTIDDLKDLVR